MAPIVDTETDFGPGRSTTGLARVPGVPTFSSNATGQILFTFDDNGNAASVECAIACYVDDVSVGFLDLTLHEIANVAEDWNTIAEWGSYVTAALHSSSALVTTSYYQFKVKARNQENTETAYSALSAKMMPYRRLAYGPLSSALSYEITSGNTLVSGLSISGTSKTVTVSYTLTNKSSTASRIDAEYKRSTDVSYSTATKGSGGDAITALTTSSTGTAHTFMWDTGTDLGTSAVKSITFKITPYDDSPTGGDAGTAATTTVTINNLPNQLDAPLEVNNYTWDKDTAPAIVADMEDLVLGSYAYFILYVYNSSGTIIQTVNSSEVIDGWEYEQDNAGHPGTWTDMPVTGVPAAYLPPTLTGNRVKYTYQTAIAVGAVTFKILQAEDFHET